MLMQAINNKYLIYVIYEGIIILMALISLVLTYVKYRQKKHPLTKLLLMIMVNWTIAIVFSWLSKYIQYLGISTVITPGNLEFWTITRILGFRISFIFVLIAIYISYILRVKLFSKEMNKISKSVHLAFMIATMFLTIFMFEYETPTGYMYDVVVFILVFVFMSIVYGVFLNKLNLVFKNVDDASKKNAFLSLIAMCVLYILVFLNFLVDRIMILLGDPGYTIFYYAAWICVILGFITTYLGYIRKR
ncbi:MAG: hypothetical protein ACTSVI_13960 [Promethearchaeota archaeon]